MTKNTEEINEAAWNHRTYEWWEKYNGSATSFGEKIASNPNEFINHRFKPYLKEAEGKRILNPLGSNGRKAVPLAKLGADVTIIDISHENERYAMELAETAHAKINYFVEEFATYNNNELKNSFDIALAEGGILHYFSEINLFFSKVSSYLCSDGLLILNDFHPYRKIRSPELGTEGNYFDSKLHLSPLPYEKSLLTDSSDEFPKCELRFYTLSEIVNAAIEHGFIIQ